MRLGQLKPAPGSTSKRKRRGCGPGSGHGKTSCRGHKGQNSRSGGGVRASFEGGQMPLHRRLPKRGFTNIFKVENQVVNLRDLERMTSDEVTPDTLLESGLIRNTKRPVKILGEGEVNKAFKINVHRVSKSAQAAIEKAGGQISLIAPRPKYVRDKNTPKKSPKK